MLVHSVRSQGAGNEGVTEDDPLRQKTAVSYRGQARRNNGGPASVAFANDHIDFILVWDSKSEVATTEVRTC